MSDEPGNSSTAITSLLKNGFKQSTRMKSEFDLLDKHIRQNELFNGNILAAKKNDILYSGSFGSCNDKHLNKSIDRSTIFELASVSKQFTAYAALKTFKTANESIDTDIRKYLIDFPYEGITVRNLLNHTSGLPDYFQLFDKHWDKNKIT